MILQILMFIGSLLLLSFLSSRLVATLVSIAKRLHWREFIVAFFVMAFAGCVPNLFIDINSVLQGLPEIAFGDILGGNLVDLTLIIAIAALFSAKGLPAESRMVQKSALFTSAVVILPIILIWDSVLSRTDGFILLGVFGLYVWWIFSKEDRFKKAYVGRPKKIPKGRFGLWSDIIKIIIFLGLLLAASFFIIDSVQFFSVSWGIPLSLVSILVVGLGNCFPEGYFSILSARKGETWMILGDLMGSVIVCATLVLGIVCIISPFRINDLSPFLITRVFTVVASILFIVLIRSEEKISRKEGLLFLSVYIVFLLAQVFAPYFINFIG